MSPAEKEARQEQADEGWRNAKKSESHERQQERHHSRGHFAAKEKLKGLVESRRLIARQAKQTDSGDPTADHAPDEDRPNCPKQQVTELAKIHLRVEQSADGLDEFLECQLGTAEAHAPKLDKLRRIAGRFEVAAVGAAALEHKFIELGVAKDFVFLPDAAVNENGFKGEPAERDQHNADQSERPDGEAGGQRKRAKNDQPRKDFFPSDGFYGRSGCHDAGIQPKERDEQARIIGRPQGWLKHESGLQDGLL